MIRFLIISLLLIAPVSAAPKNAPTSIAITCGMVREMVAKYGPGALEALARLYGLSESNRQKAIRICLKH